MADEAVDELATGPFAEFFDVEPLTMFECNPDAGDVDEDKNSYPIAFSSTSLHGIRS